MLQFTEPNESLPTRIRRDASTNLPLLSEQHAVFKIILAYLALPYSVAEYGCGKKCSLIIERLINMGVPPWAIRRGIAVERDMSPAAMDEWDPARRPHAITLHNPLAALGDLGDPRLREMLAGSHYDIEVDEACIRVGRYVLHHADRVQLAHSRSHIFPVVTFWDETQGRALERIVDPTLDREQPFPLSGLRPLLRAEEALILTAPIFGHFRLRASQLTEQQRREVDAFVDREQCDPDLIDMPLRLHNRLVRELNGAVPDSVGDCESWTYANSYHGHDAEHTGFQREFTGRGDEIRPLVRELIKARESFSHETGEIRAELDQLMERIEARRILRTDSVWSEARLEPLAEVALTMVYFNSLRHLADRLRSDTGLRDELAALRSGTPLRGIGVRLRRRIDRLGVVSISDEGHIDARALNDNFCASAIETARQMNEAGLTVFVDKVGNLHGILLQEKERRALTEGAVSVRELLTDAVCHFSHIDTVGDAGKFDGRLGVTAGIETAHLIRDLHRYCDVPTGAPGSAVKLMVTAFVGEEMTFTGQGVSMPGSAAFAGRAKPEQVHEMRNGRGERYGDRLVALLEQLRRAAGEGLIELAHSLDGEGAGLIDACAAPADFFTPHSYERHIEQGPVLDRHNVPIALVGRIMGIHQEDFVIQGQRAEQAALEMNCRLRDLTGERQFSDTRVTVGIYERRGEPVCYPSLPMGLRCVLEGEMNHAGATQTPDRKDPGVAVGRLARSFQQWVDERRDRLGDVRAVVGDVTLYPGNGRNVIPGLAGATFALEGDKLDEEYAEEVFRVLRAKAVGELSANVAAGGEGARVKRMEPVSFVNSGAEVRISLDLRDAEQSTTEVFRERLLDIRQHLEQQFDVSITSTVEQTVVPSDLEPTGQVLLMERSYGGSHNPNETELLTDLTRGCMLQYAVMRDVLARDSLADVNLFKVTEQLLPDSWLQRVPRFTSGALHDTCNVVARVLAD